MTQSSRFWPAYVLVTCLAAAVASGCAGGSNSRFVGLAPQQARAVARQMAEQRETELEADLREAFAGRPPRNVLVLSGGDADGAFGCGVLAGWRESPAGPRPAFDVVTGVSTGALMGAFAFLGEPRDDETLRAVYTTSSDRDIFDGPFTPGPPNAVFDTRPLKQLIARHVTGEVLARVGVAHRQGRRLYVATADMDAGALAVWPMSRIAAEATALGGPDETAAAAAARAEAGLEKFRQVLLAAAAIPVFFPPVEIDGNLHVDAGLREVMFLRRAMLGLPPGSDAPDNTLAPTESAPPTVYAIVNGKLNPDPEAVPNDLVHIGIRSLTVYTKSLQLFNLRETAHVAMCHNPPFRFRYVAEPDDFDGNPGPGLFTPMFGPSKMRRLYDLGKAMGRAAKSPWNEGLPPLDGERGG